MSTQIQVTADTSQAQTQLKNFVGNMNSQLSGLAGKAEAFGNKFKGAFVGFAAIGAVVAGGFELIHKGIEAVMETVSEFVNSTYETTLFAKQLGISAEKASILKVALDDTFISTETYNTAIGKVTVGLNKNEKSFTDLGIATRGAGGELLNSTVILQATVDKLNSLKAGTDRNVVMAQLFGKGWQSLVPVLNLTAQSMEEARKKAEDLGLVTTKADVEAAMAYKHALNDRQDASEGYAKAAGRAFTDLLTDINIAFTGSGESVTAFGYAMATLAYAGYLLLGMFDSLIFVLKEGGNAVGAMIEAFITLGKVVNLVATGQFSKIGDAIKNSGAREQVSNISKDYEDLVKKLESHGEKGAKAFTVQGGGKVSDADLNATTGGEAGTPKSTKGANVSEHWASELAAQKIAFQQTHDGYQMALADEQKFWEGKLLLAQKGSKEEQAVNKKIAEAKEKIAKQEGDNRIALAQNDIDVIKNSALNALAIEEDNAKQRNKIGQTSDEQYLAEQIAFENRRYQIASDAIDARIELMQRDPNVKPVDIQKAQQEKVRAEEKRVLKIQILVEDQDKVDEVFASVIAHQNSVGDIFSQKAFDNALVGMESSLSNFFGDVLTQATSFQEAMSALWSSMKKIFIQKLVTEPLAAFIIGEARQLAVSMFTDKAKTVSATQAATAQVGLSTVSSNAAVGAKVPEATAVVSANAAEGASGAAASQAAIPVVGPGLAVAAFVATLALILGAKSLIKSAAGGYDIPKGLNPMTQLHAEEMVLPASLANKVRSIGGGLNNSTSAQQMTNNNVSLNISTIDAKGVSDYFNRNPKVLTKILAQKARLGV